MLIGTIANSDLILSTLSCSADTDTSGMLTMVKYTVSMERQISPLLPQHNFHTHFLK